MTCPAELTFKRDRRLRPSTRRMYDFLSTVLDIWEIRDWKLYVLADEVGIDKKSAVMALRELFAAGYVIGHGRAQRGVYRMTLAYSVDPAKRKTSTHPMR